MKRLEKLKLNEKKIIEQLSNGELKHLLGGYGNGYDGYASGHPNDCLLAGCSCDPEPQRACYKCLA